MLLGYKQQQWSTGWWRWFPYVKQVLPKWKQKRKRVFLRLFLFQMEIQHEWKALAYVLNDVLRLDAAVAASQATWLVKNSNSVFRGCCCAQWAPGQGCGKEETGCAWTSPSPHVGQLVLGHPKVTGKGRHTCGVARKVYLWARRKQKRNKVLGVYLHCKLTTVLSMLCPALHTSHPHCSVP